MSEYEPIRWHRQETLEELFGGSLDDDTAGRTYKVRNRQGRVVLELGENVIRQDWYVKSDSFVGGRISNGMMKWLARKILEERGEVG